MCDPTPRADQHAPHAEMNCTAGWYGGSAWGSICRECPTGAFSASKGLRKCAHCAPGGTTDKVLGATACVACKRGQADIDRNTSTACQACTAGRYARPARAVECAACGQGQYGASARRTRFARTVVLPGWPAVVFAWIEQLGNKIIVSH